MITLTRAERMADSGYRLMTPWQEFPITNNKTIDVIKYTFMILGKLPSMAWGAILFLTAIWFLPDVDP